MNNLLRLSKEFGARGAGPAGPATLPAGQHVSSDKIDAIRHSLEASAESWQGDGLLDGLLISVEYRQIVAKSNRIRRLLSGPNRLEPESSIRGASYLDFFSSRARHVMTHYVSRDTVDFTLEDLKEASRIVRDCFGGCIATEDLDRLWESGLNREQWGKRYSLNLAKTAFAQIIRDCHYVNRFFIRAEEERRNGPSIVTLYKTEKDVRPTLSKLGIEVPAANVLNNSVLLTESDFNLLLEKAPYLVAMSTVDFSKLDPLTPHDADVLRTPTLPAYPGDEPTIGVIDTPFDIEHPPYFANWVTYCNMLDDDIIATPKDAVHGTCVDSLIVDAPFCNPWLDDGCGHFKVRHFGVAMADGYSSFEIIKKLERILEQNPDIKVWNISLGSTEQISLDSISPEAAVLDELQTKYDVLFIVAGTNQEDGKPYRIGSPADSINALVVNAVTRNRTPASYTRRGPVLHFHHKPDIAYYGGDEGETLTVCSATGEKRVSGTSFAAPLVARKASYLIDKMHLSCEAAKALLIDSACVWTPPEDMNSLGYGVIPIRIEQVLQTANNEIRFIIDGIAREYETFNYELPIPRTKNSHPSVVRATLCYFPECNRNQGVDYTCTELDLHFGRIKDGKIISLKQNTQGDEDDRTDEEAARKKLRKWDNTKQVADILTSRTRAKKAYDNPLWGIKIRKTSRYLGGSTKPQKFSLVVTVRDLKGINRFGSFVQQCSALGWHVNEISIDNQIDIYESSQVEIIFE